MAKLAKRPEVGCWPWGTCSNGMHDLPMVRVYTTCYYRSIDFARSIPMVEIE